MAIVSTSQVLMESPSEIVVKFTRSQGLADAHETAAVKIDVSALSPPCSEVNIQSLWFSTNFQSVTALWDATADVPVFIIGGPGGQGYLDFADFGGLNNSAGAGKTGDLLFTTVGTLSVATYYTVVLSCLKIP